MKLSHFGTRVNVNVELCVTSSRVAQFVISLIFCSIKMQHQIYSHQFCSKSHHFYSILHHVCFFVLHTKWNVKIFLFPLFSKLATDQYEFGTEINWILQFHYGCNKVVLKLRVMRFWSEIILVISNRTRAARSSDLKNTRMISNQFALHSDWLSLLIKHNIVTVQWGCYALYQAHCFIFHDSLSLRWNLGPFSPLSDDFNRFQASDFSQRYYIC